MISPLRALSAVLLLALLTACGGDAAPDDPAEAGSQLAGVLDEVSDELEGVSSEADLEAAKPRLKELAAELATLRDHYERMAEDQDAQERWDEGASEELMQAQARMSQAMMKVGMNPALAQKFSEVMQEFGDAFETR